MTKTQNRASLDLAPTTHDRRPKTKKPNSGTEIFNQGLDFILNTVWIFLARVVFVKQKYSLQININFNINNSNINFSINILRYKTYKFSLTGFKSRH